MSCATYIICDPLYENRTYKAISNFEKGAKVNFVSNMASRSTVSLKPFASKLCFLVCQQNLVVELYCGCTMDLDNLVAFQRRPLSCKQLKAGHQSKI